MLKQIIKFYKRKNKPVYDLTGKQLFKKLRIEINADCTRKCKFCPRTFDKKRQNNHQRMPQKKVLSIIDQSIEMGFTGEVGFDFYNEPTLDDRLLFFINYAKEKDLSVALVTNGDLLKANKEYARELFNASSNVYLSLYDYDDKKGRDLLIDQWTNFINEINIPQKKVKFKGNYFEFGNRAGSIERNDIYNHNKELDDKTPIKAACKKFISKLNIRYDGEVAICCEDAFVQCSLGNVNDLSISEIWMGDKRMRIARELAEGNRKNIIPCNKCVQSMIRINF